MTAVGVRGEARGEEGGVRVRESPLRCCGRRTCRVARAVDAAALAVGALEHAVAGVAAAADDAAAAAAALLAVEAEGAEHARTRIKRYASGAQNGETCSICWLLSAAVVIIDAKRKPPGQQAHSDI